MSGAKHDANKAPLHLLPPAPLVEIARVLDFGQRKYAAWNWCGGFAASRLFSATIRHLWAWWCGEDNDAESGLPHLAHAGCCLLFLADLRLKRPDGWVDDRPVGLVANPFDRPSA